jgi:hypothetical protein
MHQEHPDFKPPTDSDAQLWRYVDLARFLSMLTTRTLFLARADLLGDPFEGTISKATIDSYNDPRQITSLAGFQGTLRELRTSFRRNVAVSCWHMAACESVAMWNVYAPKGNGIAIRTSYSRLVQSLAAWPTPIFIGCVNYLDYGTARIEGTSLLAPFIHKRREYDAERELRVIVSELPTTQQNGVAVIDYAGSMPPGIPAPVDLALLVEAIVLAPGTPVWQADSLRDVVSATDQSFPIEQSVLDRETLLG